MTTTSRKRTTRLVAIAALLLVSESACATGRADDEPPATSMARPRTGNTADTTPPCVLGEGVAIGEVVEATMTSGAAERRFVEFVPIRATGDGRLAMVIDLHGYGAGTSLQVPHSDLVETAGALGYVYLAPEGTGTPVYWNSVRRPTGTDDVQFIEDLIDRAVSDRCVDPGRILVAGLSNGALLASQVACRLSTKVTAIAAIAGLDRPPDCRPSRPVPVIAFHGGDDTYIKIDGGFGTSATAQPLLVERLVDDAGRGPAPARTAAQEWAEGNGCRIGPTETEPVDGVELLVWTACEGGAEVRLYVTPRSGHVWPGSDFEHDISLFTGATNDLVDANELISEFFQARWSDSR